MFTVKFENHTGGWRIVAAEEVRVAWDVPNSGGDPVVVTVNSGGMESTLVTHHTQGRIIHGEFEVAVNAYIENEQGRTTEIVRPRHGPAVIPEDSAA